MKVGALFLVVIAGLISPARAGGSTEKIFQCSLGKKQVIITRIGQTYSYSFGAPGSPELRFAVSSESGNVFASGSFGTLDGFQTLRLRNGQHSYVAYFDGLTEHYATPKAFRSSGLLVLNGTSQVARIPCTKGPGFSPGWDTDNSPPDDPLELEIG
jgi:hypothetical protein